MVGVRSAPAPHFNVMGALLCLALALVAPATAADPPDYFLTCDRDSIEYIYENWWLDHEVPCQLTIDGLTWPDCTVRIRGDSSREYPKKSLKIKTDGALFPSGNDVLNLNADWLDRSYMRTVLATTLFERAGVPCFDASHARLHLNGMFHGLYVEVQNMDEDFLAANGLSPDGNLYKATHDGASLTIDEDLRALWEKKTNEDGDWGDLEQLVADLDAVDDAGFADWAAGALDLPEVISLVACNALLGNGSTYYHNYYVYRDAAGPGVWQVFPWDLDKTFAGYGTTYDYDRTSTSQLPDNPLPEHIFASTEVFDLFHARVDELVDTVFNLAFFDPLIDSLRVSIEPSVAADLRDDVPSLGFWNAFIATERSVGVTSRTADIQDQLDHAPRVFRLAPFEDALQDSVTFAWTPSHDPDGDPVTYTLRFSPGSHFHDGITTTVTGLTTTSYTPPTALADTLYYWQVFADDADPTHTRQGTDSWNTLLIDRGTGLPPQIDDHLVLTAEGSPWFVDRDVTIASGVVVTIEPGAELRLADGVSLLVHGRLVAAGTAQQPIRLRSQLGGGPWGAVCFSNGDTGSRLHHVAIEGATRSGDDDPRWQAAVSSWLTPLELEDVVFVGCGQSVYVQTGDLTARRCRFDATNAVEMLKVQAGTVLLEDCAFVLAAGDGDAIDLDAITGGTVRGCTFQGGHQGDDLIDIGSHSTDLVLDGNLLVNAADNGISVGEGSAVTVVRNVVRGCVVGLSVKDGSTAVLDRSTLHANGLAVRAYEKTAGWGGGQVDVASSILAASTTAAVSSDALSTVTVRYSLADTELLAGEGNLQADPMFVDPPGGDLRLATGSPCINAGDPEADPDPDGTRADMGALYHDLAIRALVINEINYNAADTFDPGDWVEIHNPSPVTVDVGGLQFRDEGHSWTVPAGTQVTAGGFLVLAESLADFRALFPSVEGVLGDLDFGLAGSGELLQLVTADGVMVDAVAYDDAPPWPVEPDGGGPTLELLDPALDNALGTSWAASFAHGTPGAVNSVVIGVEPTDTPTHTRLESVFPSPFNPTCTVAFTLARTDRVDLAVHDLRGRRVAVLLAERRASGRHQISWDGRDGSGRALASGVYLIRLRAGGQSEVRKTVLVR